jgi:hypothetical protein
MGIRRVTFWFKLFVGGYGHVRRRPGDTILGSHHKTVLATRTTRGVWGEWW